MAKLTIPAPRLAKRPLPAPKRWWRIGRALPPRETESQSSLSQICYHTHQWVLNHHAKLRPGRITGIVDGSRLKGKLAHRLFEQFFTENAQWRTLDAAAVDAWFNEEAGLEDLIEKEGAVLLEAGRGVERQETATTLHRALSRLLRHLWVANVVGVQCEQPIDKPFPGAEGLALRGNADLVLVDERGRRAVLDAKWSGERYRRQEMEDGRHLQLAVYAFALAEDAWPAPGYYMIETGNVLAPDRDFFPEALDIVAEAVTDVWGRCLVTYAWRIDQVARGEIEVNAGVEPDEHSEPPADGLDIRVDADRFGPFRWLTGLEPYR